MKNEVITADSKEKFFKISSSSRTILFFILMLMCLLPFISAPVALLAGIAAAHFPGNPILRYNSKIAGYLLQVSVAGLGFGMNAATALHAGSQGLIFSIVSILVTFVVGAFFGKLFGTETKTSFLISSGTAICGGSAIAAVSPAVDADEKQTGIALATVFILNAAALFIFPAVGNLFGLSQHQFGLWCAVAIHDTSSVTGAAAKYGSEALQIAVAVKLTRALWIIPAVLIASLLFRSKGRKIKIPYFIAFFAIAVVLNTYFPSINKWSNTVVNISKTGLTLTLFLIGAGFSRRSIAAAGIKPLLQGLSLWIFISVCSLTAVMYLL